MCLAAAFIQEQNRIVVGALEAGGGELDGGVYRYTSGARRWNFMSGFARGVMRVEVSLSEICGSRDAMFEVLLEEIPRATKRLKLCR